MNDARKTKRELIEELQRLRGSLEAAPPSATAANGARDSRYSLLFEQSYDAIYITTLDGEIVDLNPAARRLLGFSADETIDLNAADLYANPGDRERFAALVEEKGSVRDVPVRLKDKDGHPLDCLITSTHWRGPDGRAAGYQGIIRDVSAQQKAQAEIRQLRELNEAIVQNVAEGIVVEDSEGFFSFVNPAAARLLGYESSELVGKHWTEVIPPEQHEIVRAANQRRQQGLADRYEVDVVDRHGRRFSVLAAGSPRLEDEVIKGTIVVFSDISHQKQAERDMGRYLDRLDLLREIDRAILAAESHTAIAEVALGYLRQLLDAPRASVVLFDQDAHTSQILLAQVNGESNLRSPLVVPTDSLFPIEELAQDKPRVIEDIDQLEKPTPTDRRLLAEGIRAYVNVPLIYKGMLIGSLNLGKKTPGLFSQEEMQIMREVANSLSIAIQQARLHEAEHSQRVMAEALQATATLLNSTLDLENVLAAVLETVERVVPHDSANIMLLEGDIVRVVAHRGYRDQSSNDMLKNLALPLAGVRNLQQIVDSGRGLIIPDVREFEGWLDIPESDWIRSYAAAPIKLGDTILGFLNLDSSKVGFFSEAAIQPLQAFADQAALAIHNARLFEREQSQHNVESTLRQAAAVLNATLDLDAVLGLILQQLRTVIGYDTASVQQLQGDHLTILAAQGFDESEAVVGLRFPLEDGFPNARIIRRKVPFASPDIAQDYPHFHAQSDQYFSGHIRSWMGVPLMVGDEPIGMIALDRRQVQPFTDYDVELAAAFAHHAAIAIHNANLFELARRRAEQLEALREATLNVTYELNLDLLLNTLVRNALKLLGVSSGGMYVYDPDQNVLKWIVSLGPLSAPAGSILKRGEGVAGKVWETGQAFIVDDYAAWEGRSAAYQGYDFGATIGVPIQWAGEFLGVINAITGRENGRHFSEDDKYLLSLFADQAAVAIQNARLHLSIKNRAARLELIANASRHMTASLDFDFLLAESVRLINSTFGAYRTFLMLVEEEDVVVKAAAPADMAPRGQEARLRIGVEGLTGWVAAHGEALIVPDVSRDPRYYRAESAPDTQSELAVPLKIGEQTIGVLNVQSERLNAFNEDDRATLQTIADQLAVAMENASLYEQSKRQASQMMALYRTSLEISSTHTLPDLLWTICDRAAKLLDLNKGGLYFYDMVSQEVELVVSYKLEQDFTGTRFKAGTGVAGRVVKSGQPLVVQNYSEWAGRAPVYESEQFASIIGIPLVWQDQVVGAITLATEDTLRTFSEDDQRLMNLFAQQAAIAIVNMRLMEQVQRHAEEMEGRVAERTSELQQANERLLALSQIKDDFIANVSHELRTPISSLKLYLKLIALNPDKTQPYLETLDRETQRLEHLVENLLYLSRLDQNRLKYKPSRIDLNRLVQTFVSDRVELAAQRGLDLTFTSADDLPDVEADPALVSQALGILITNGLNYTPAGGAVRVSTVGRRQQGRDWVGIQVRDTGPGILPTEQDRLFERFFRGEAALMTGTAGTGLGLAIAREIIEMHGGTVDVDASAPAGEGAAFVIWLPVDRGV